MILLYINVNIENSYNNNVISEGVNEYYMDFYKYK